MPKFIIAAHGGKKLDNPAKTAKHMERMRTWFGSLSDSIVDSGSPIRNSMTVSSDGVSSSNESTRLTGYSIIKADSIEDVIEIAKKCPHLDKGTMEVAELLEM